MIASLQAAAASAAPSAAPAVANAGGAGELLRVVLSLAAVVVMILAVGWLTRRMQARVRPGGQRVRCVETLAVGMKERVLLLEVGDRQLVVGASPSGLRTLLVLDEPLPAPKSPTDAPISPLNFRDALARWRKPQ
ncbi:MAG: flagellar biosynthetic protein FliO [Xanthomonadales bacterium]|nr:flagellar biosynthetic protein FliO [Xanthomonadales bacterium]ODU95289.1 MAG: flagellar biosynthetic protein FliO [Rhodanobacter sp. SCN 66-43]OJY83015.1 MAG: flagellar biosynthetic protein FliO [Xanthomonadales bacterium 66-474]